MPQARGAAGRRRVCRVCRVWHPSCGAHSPGHTSPIQSNSAAPAAAARLPVEPGSNLHILFSFLPPGRHPGPGHLARVAGSGGHRRWRRHRAGVLVLVGGGKALLLLNLDQILGPTASPCRCLTAPRGASWRAWRGTARRCTACASWAASRSWPPAPQTRPCGCGGRPAAAAARAATAAATKPRTPSGLPCSPELRQSLAGCAACADAWPAVPTADRWPPSLPPSLPSCPISAPPSPAPAPHRLVLSSHSSAATRASPPPHPPLPAPLQRPGGRGGVGVRPPLKQLPHLRSHRRHLGILRRRGRPLRGPGGSWVPFVALFVPPFPLFQSGYEQ